MFPGIDREGVAVVRTQVHGQVRLPELRRPEGDVACLHPVPGGRVADDVPVPVRLPVQRALPAHPARSRVLVSVRHLHRQL